MAGIYVHIPFCKQKCSYCNFHFSVSLRNKADLVAAIIEEIKQRKDYVSGCQINSLYFGGGTPSILTSLELRAIVDAVKLHFDISSDAEFTLEANPDDLHENLLEEYFDLGINRLSIGIQSFNDKDLSLMNRAHTSAQASRSVAMAQSVGFINISIDLIYGTPTMTDQEWKDNMQLAIDLGIQHISAYALTVEPRTVLAHQVKKGEVVMPSQDEVSEQFLAMIGTLKTAGFEQYEVSNFCTNGCYSRHNSSYWKSIPYIGLGPSAHSYDGESRRWNVSSNQKYIDAINQGDIFFESEKIDISTSFNEYIMLGLRTKWGIDISHINKKYNFDIVNGSSWFDRYSNDIVLDGDVLRLTNSGLLKADRIASDLMIVD